MFQRDRLRVSVRDVKVKIFVDVLIEVKLALLDQLHYGRPYDQLGGGPNAEHRLPGIHRDPVLQVGVAVAFGEEQLAVFHDGHGGPGDVVLFHLLRQQAVHEGFKLSGIGGTLRPGRGRDTAPWRWPVCLGQGRRRYGQYESQGQGYPSELHEKHSFLS
jgi:hypothetical protein